MVGRGGMEMWKVRTGRGGMLKIFLRRAILMLFLGKVMQVLISKKI